MLSILNLSDSGAGKTLLRLLVSFNLIFAFSVPSGGSKKYSSENGGGNFPLKLSGTTP